jgi:hypothetical protein
MARLRSRFCRRADFVVPCFDGFQRSCKHLLQLSIADNPKERAEQPPLEVLALAHNIHVGRPVGLTRESIGVARATSPQVGVSSGKNDVVGIGPVVCSRSQIPLEPSVTSALVEPFSCTFR